MNYSPLQLRGKNSRYDPIINHERKENTMNETKLSNPAPLGLAAFGLTTILLNLANTGAFAINGAILAMGVFYGGLGQVIAGISEFKTGNTFAMTAFTSYGMFWLTLVAIVVTPKLGWIESPPSDFMGWYLFFWGLFTFFMWLGTFGKTRGLQLIFLTLWILFFLLALHEWTAVDAIGKLAGWEGLLCGLTAFYVAMAEIINDSRGRKALPL
jgi:succinate-acetate transporter protein